MPVIQAGALLEGVTCEVAWQLVSDGARVASRARHVVAVRPGPSSGAASRLCEWTVLLNGSEVCWTQREAAGPGPRLRFEQVDGDLESLAGHWSVEPAPEGARVTLVIEFELGVDGLAPLLEPMWSQSFQAHADELLRAVVAESAPPRAGVTESELA